MTQAAVVVRDRSARWRNVGVAFRHRNGGGWNIQLEGGVPDEMLVIRDANGYEPGAQFRLMVTRPAVSGGTDWFEVGRAWVSREGREGRAVLATLDVIIPAGETKLVILPKRSRAVRA